MRISTEERGGKAVLYQLSLSENETYDWANKPNGAWPCSMLAGKRLRVSVDLNGLFDVAVNGKFADVDNTELQAIVSDFIPDNCKHLWPCWN